MRSHRLATGAALAALVLAQPACVVVGATAAIGGTAAIVVGVSELEDDCSTEGCIYSNLFGYFIILLGAAIAGGGSFILWDVAQDAAPHQAMP